MTRYLQHRVFSLIIRVACLDLDSPSHVIMHIGLVSRFDRSKPFEERLVDLVLGNSRVGRISELFEITRPEMGIWLHLQRDEYTIRKSSPLDWSYVPHGRFYQAPSHWDRSACCHPDQAMRNVPASFNAVTYFVHEVWPQFRSHSGIQGRSDSS